MTPFTLKLLYVLCGLIYVWCAYKYIITNRKYLKYIKQAEEAVMLAELSYDQLKTKENELIEYVWENYHESTHLEWFKKNYPRG